MKAEFQKTGKTNLEYNLDLKDGVDMILVPLGGMVGKG